MGTMHDVVLYDIIYRIMAIFIWVSQCMLMFTCKTLKPSKIHVWKHVPNIK